MKEVIAVLLIMSFLSVAVLVFALAQKLPTAIGIPFMAIGLALDFAILFWGIYRLIKKPKKEDEE